MRVLDVGPGNRVVTSPNTFLASANAAAYVGATPDFCDIDPVSYNLDPVVLESGWRDDTKAVVAVDYAGQPCEMTEIARIARDHGAYVIEDACHGVGSGFLADGKRWKLGGHPWADITTFSFHPVKTMTTGEGGMLVTDNDVWASEARLLLSHGVTRNPADFVGLTDATFTNFLLPSAALDERGPWYYEMRDLGYNYRVTDMQCALGRSQLRRLPDFMRRRQEIAALYNKAFGNLDWLTTPALASSDSSFIESSNFSFQLSNLSLHLYTVQIEFEAIGLTRTQVMAELRSKGVGSQVLYIPVHLQPWYRETYGYNSGKCPVAEAFYTRALSLPLYSDLHEVQQKKVINAVLSLI